LAGGDDPNPIRVLTFGKQPVSAVVFYLVTARLDFVELIITESFENINAFQEIENSHGVLLN
jgi:hypothetical protein